MKAKMKGRDVKITTLKDLTCNATKGLQAQIEQSDEDEFDSSSKGDSEFSDRMGKEDEEKALQEARKAKQG